MLRYRLYAACSEDAETLASFEALYYEQVAAGTSELITYTLEAPKWQFLCYLTDTKDVLLHGSVQEDITEFELRQAVDAYAFGNQKAIYAASDGIWPLYFAIINMRRHRNISRLNACSRLLDQKGKVGEAHYFFSLNREVLEAEPWCPGTIYVLPKATFVQEPVQTKRGTEYQSAQRASLVSVKPLAKLSVEPKDFPFLEQMRGHDTAMVSKLAREDPEGFPWLDEGGQRSAVMLDVVLEFTFSSQPSCI